MLRPSTRPSSTRTVTASTRIEHPESVTVYNMTVAGDHTYFVADAEANIGDAVWVHNASCGRPVGARIKEFAICPGRWKLVRAKSEASTNIRNKDGTNYQELFRNEETGEELVRQTIFKADGSVFAPAHFRDEWK
ncbi:MAG: hypothetical protein QM770_20000 [Tepidisphaeraceae bacterium]